MTTADPPANRYQISYDPRAVRELSKLDQGPARRVYAAVTALADDPRPAGCRPLTGYPGLWRIRISDWRVIYTIDDAGLIVLVLRIAHRREVYRRL